MSLKMMRSLTFSQIKRVKFYRMGVLGPPSMAELKVLSSGKGPGLPGSHPGGKTPEPLLKNKYFVMQNRNGKMRGNLSHVGPQSS